MLVILILKWRILGEEETATLKKKEKSAFTIRLTKFDDTKKVQLIKEIKSLVEGMNLVQVRLLRMLLVVSKSYEKN